MTEDVTKPLGDDAAAEGAGESQLPMVEPRTDEPEGEALSAPEPAPPPAAEIDFKDRWLRAEAELQNFRRRAAREREDSVARAQDSLLLDVIAVLDDLERALASIGTAEAAEAWAQGVALTAQRLRDTLARWDVVEIDAQSRPFDPRVHEAILEIDAPEGVAPGDVAQVVLKGYRRGERALRAARVVVAKAVAQESP